VARQIDARGIMWWRALLLFPFLLGPWILLKGAGTLLVRAAQRARETWRERPSNRRPPQPTGLGLFVLVLLFAGGVLSITFAAKGVADRVAATGLMLVALATAFVSPPLLSLDALAKLDGWWLSTELPAYQLAFADHIRRVVRVGLRLALTVLGATFVLGAVDVVLSALPLPKAAHESADSFLVVLAWSFSVSVTAAVVAGILRLIVGSPSSGPPEPVTTASASELQRDPDRQRRNASLAALLFAAGTLLSFVAVVFLQGS
jgi:hypothetical protein